MEELKLNNGQMIPQLGLGVFKVQDADDQKYGTATRRMMKQLPLSTNL